MYLKKSKQSNGRIHLDIMDSYYDPVKKTTRQTTIKSLGYVDQLEQLYDDPIKHYTDLLNEYKKIIGNDPLALSFHFKKNEKIDINNIYEKNFGFIIFSKIYHSLGLHNFFANKQRHREDNYNANSLFKILLENSLLYHNHSTSWLQNKKMYKTQDMISFFDFIHKNTFDLFKWINKYLSNYYDRGNCYIYENIAKFTFTDSNTATMEINRNKTSMSQGSIYISMYIDSIGVPYAYRKIDKDNRLENYGDFLDQLKQSLNVKKFVLVGDRLESSEDELNQEILANGNIRHLFSINPATASLETQKYILNQALEQPYNKGTQYKTRLHHREVPLGGGKHKIVLENQVILRSRSKKNNDMQRRANLIDEAMLIIDSPESFTALDMGHEVRYLKKVVFQPDGKIDVENSILEIDEDRIAHEEQFDGINFIITNDSNNSISHIIDVYYYQYSLENVLKNIHCAMQKKPLILSQEDYNKYTTTVNTITFTGFLMLRLLFWATDKKYPMTQLLKAVSKYNCVQLQQNYYMFTYFDDILDELGEVLNLDLNKRIRTLQEINHLIAQAKKID